MLLGCCWVRGTIVVELLLGCCLVDVVTLLGCCCLLVVLSVCMLASRLACLPAYLSVCLSVCRVGFLSCSLAALLIVSLSVCLSACLSECLSICVSVCLSDCKLSGPADHPDGEGIHFWALIHEKGYMPILTSGKTATTAEQPIRQHIPSSKQKHIAPSHLSTFESHHTSPTVARTCSRSRWDP